LKHLTESYPATQLYGVDPVKEMLSAARQRLPATVDLQVGWANQLPFEDYYFDVVISNSVFHHIPDAQAALQEIQRVLRPQGTFILTDWCRDYFTIRIIDYFLKKFNDAYFQSYRSSDMTRLLKENNFTILDMDSYRINPWWGLVAVKASSSGRPGTAN
jgi:ubiquinone/menaquinone biosynthesis C-methylase UbiE